MNIINQKFCIYLFILLVSYSCNLKDKGTKQELKVNTYFSSIKNDKGRLTDFFLKMPKGGNIHQHAVGAVYAEKIIEFALDDSCYINPNVYQLYANQDQALKWGDQLAIPINTLLIDEPNKRDSIINYWSVRNYKKFNRDGRSWFFDAFMKIIPACIGNEAEILTELCKKAKEENVQYIETMIGVANVENSLSMLAYSMEQNNTYNLLDSGFEGLYERYKSYGMDELAKEYADSLDSFISRSDTNGVTLRCQIQGSRLRDDHVLTFGKLMLAFKTAELTNNLVGVNFAGPEDYEVSLENYSLHMHMFQFLRAKHPNVDISLHAGELALGKGATRDKDLKFHIYEAIAVAGASRIGHGVDLFHESKKDEIIKLMKEKGVAVEINLESNEVILETNPQTHPVNYYLDKNIPICLCTDDEGILRTNLTNQYLLLLDYVPNISYLGIKQIVKNSIQYSFLDSIDKQSVLDDLEEKFDVFEKHVISGK